MDIERISAELRPRRQWEAVDLGVSLCRRHLGKLLLFWCVSVLPLIAILSVLLWSRFQLLAIVIWWLKPLFDRVPLYYLSRALFGSAPTLREFLRVLPKLWTRRVFDALVVGRFSIVRRVVLPIKELEGLKGSAYRNRRDALLRSGGGESQWFIALCLFLEQFFTFGLILFATSAIPMVAPPDPVTYLRSLYELALAGEYSFAPLVLAGVLGAWVVAMTFTENIYVAGGFGLYLNARTELEGWDVELAFRRIANRVRKLVSGGTAGLLAAGLLAGTLMCAPAAQAADPGADPPGEVIERILDHEDFEIHVETERVPVSRDASLPAGLLRVLGGLGYLVFWVIVITLLVLLVVLIYKNRHYFVPGGREARTREREPRARTVLGMEIGRDSLPADVVDAARRAWLDGRKKDAVSLLYRGAISWLVESAEAPIRESDTESDCLRRARATEAARSRLAYLEMLTGKWIGIAYGRREPDDDEMERLLHGWPFNAGGSDA